MYARVFNLQVSTDKIDGVAQALEQRSNEVGQLAGFKAGYLLVDRQSGEAMTVTLWESEEAVQASLAAAREILSGALQASGATPSQPKTFEVATEIG